MKVLLDEDVPQKLIRSLPRHEVHTIASMGWGGFKNGALLALIAGEAFQIFVTGDKNMRNQQRLQGRPFAVLVLSAINWPVIRPYLLDISTAIDDAKPGTVQMVECGMFIPHARRSIE